MTRIHRARNASIASMVLACLGGCGDGNETGGSEELLARSGESPLVVYADPYAPDRAGTPNPIPAAAAASATAFDVDGKLHLMLVASGLPASRRFGAHLHKLPCDDASKAGGHYQHTPAPAGAIPNDPTYANSANEAWLDFTTDATGKGEADVTLPWLPRHGEARAIIIHDMATGSGGVAGPKLACLPLEGF